MEKQNGKKQILRRQWRRWGLSLVAGLLAMAFMPALFVGLGAKAANAAEATPSDVYAVLDRVDRCTDVLLENAGVDAVQRLRLREKGLRPMHAYQMGVATVDLFIEWQNLKQIRPMPKVVSTPTSYIPEDVKMLADLLARHMERALLSLSVETFPTDQRSFYGKVPTDVFDLFLSLYSKFSALIDRTRIEPSRVYAEMARGVADVKSILGQIDPARRYRIDAPQSPADLDPADVFEICLDIRDDINEIRKSYDMETIAVPAVDGDAELHPADAFIQTQVIIAELNLLKKHTGTVSATPLAMPVSGKTPSDVHQEAAMLRYLMAQIHPLQAMVRTLD